MYQWRKFEFFEEKTAGRGGGGGAPAVPAEIASRVTCCSGGRGRVAVGCDDGTVALLDRGFRLSYGFQAYASSVLFLQQLKQRNVLVTVGDDDQASSQSSAICAREKEKLRKEDAKVAKDIVDRQKKGLALLKSAWTSEMEEPLYSVDLALIICNANAFKDGLLFLYEKLKLYKEVISCYKQAHDHAGLIACCKKLGDSSQGGDPSLWGDLLKYFGDLGEDCSKEVKEVLTYIEKGDVLPPIVVLQTLSKNPCLTLSVVKDYIARKLEQESKLIEDDRKSIDKYQEETELMKRETEDLKTNAKVFQLSKCTACTFTLDLPAVHFMCMHSFHLRCLGDNEKECPECAAEYRSVMEAKQKLELNARDHALFFSQLRGSKDGFSVVADYFSKGVVSKTTVPPENGP
uniref:Uncharacterized protein n=1 Tax=Avena sativa TaxID=4498 RepID=A0ACD5UXM9_AVESA